MPATRHKSCIFEGRVRHRRFTPVEHGFDYRLFMMYLDLDEAPGLFRPVTALYADEYGKPGADLRDDFIVNRHGRFGNALQQADHKSFSGRGSRDSSKLNWPH